MKDVVRFGLAVLTLLVTLGAASAAQTTLSGEVTYRERIALPENGTLRIQLVDLATPNQPRVQAEGAIASPGQVPLSFNLTFDDSIFAAGHSYGLKAEILSGGQVWFRNAEALPVNLTTPQAIVIVTSFAGRVDDPVSRPAVDTKPILDVTWTAEEIAGLPVTPGESTLSIASDMRAGGRGGCNSYFTQAQLSNDSLAFSAVAATRMACNETVMAQEAVFFDGLNTTRFWRLAGDRLELLDAGGKVLMRLRKAGR